MGDLIRWVVKLTLKMRLYVLNNLLGDAKIKENLSMEWKIVREKAGKHVFGALCAITCVV
jgi:hypothetical protein